MNRFIYFRIMMFSFMVIAALFTACKKDTRNEPAAPTVMEKKYDVSYGSNTRNKMDVYLPANRTAGTPLAVLIHGGGWTAGDKRDMNALQDSFLARGIASVSINYRYASPSVSYVELMEDVNNAVAYCVAHAGEWQVKNHGFVIGGASAGAHMSLLYAYKYNSGNTVSAVISAAGPTDFTDFSFLNYAVLIGLGANIEYLTGDAYVFNQPLAAGFAAASPAKNIRNIPTLMIHGDADLVVPYSQAQILKAALDNASVPNKLLTIPNAGHDLGVGNAATLQLVLNEMTVWAKTYTAP